MIWFGLWGCVTPEPQLPSTKDIADTPQGDEHPLASLCEDVWPLDTCGGSLDCAQSSREQAYAAALLEAWADRQGWFQPMIDARVGVRELSCAEEGGPCRVTFSVDVAFARWFHTFEASTAGFDDPHLWAESLGDALDVGIDPQWELDEEHEVIDAITSCAEELGHTIDTSEGWQCAMWGGIPGLLPHVFLFDVLGEDRELWVDPASGETQCDEDLLGAPG